MKRVYLIALLFFFISTCFGQDEIEPKLEVDKDIEKIIKNLGDNTGVKIDGIKVHEAFKLGDFAKGWHNMKQTGPLSRNFSLKMVWMPDRKRAFFCGANHQTPHRLNDAWEYDLLSNTWVMLYVPDYNDTGKVTEEDKNALVLEDGWLKSKNGGPAEPGHTWWGLTYDAKEKSIVWYCVWNKNRLHEKLKVMGVKESELYKGPPIWTFSLVEKKWIPVKTTGSGPEQRIYAASLEYVNELGGSLLQYDNKTFLLNLKEKKWVPFRRDKWIPRESVLCYDTSDKVLIAHRSGDKNVRHTWKMSLKDGVVDKWQGVYIGEDAPPGHDSATFMHYDPKGKTALLYSRDDMALWSFDTVSNTWKKLTPEGDAPPFKGDERKVMGYMDIERNVFVVIGPSSVWCYRFKN